jgi:hypothetical protein
VIEITACGAFLPLRFWTFADAASARTRGTLIAALQPMTPNRSFRASLRHEFRTALSLQPGPAIEERTKRTFAGTAIADAALIRSCSTSLTALQPMSHKRSLRTDLNGQTQTARPLLGGGTIETWKNLLFI